MVDPDGGRQRSLDGHDAFGHDEEGHGRGRQEQRAAVLAARSLVAPESGGGPEAAREAEEVAGGRVQAAHTGEAAQRGQGEQRDEDPAADAPAADRGPTGARELDEEGTPRDEQERCAARPARRDGRRRA